LTESPVHGGAKNFHRDEGIGRCEHYPVADPRVLAGLTYSK
jgi:hypothetical protein